MSPGLDGARPPIDVDAPRSAGSLRPDLLLWLLFVAFAVAMTPPPPAAPWITDDEAQVLQRQVDRAIDRERRWESKRGDRVIPWDEARGRVAIVIDDVGRELHLFDQLLALRYRLTFAVLPHGVYTPGVQLRLRADRRRPRDILLHLPMEPREHAAMEPEIAAGEVFLRTTDDDAAIAAKVRAALDRVPAAVGVSNHMGSAFTAEAHAMAAVMKALVGRDLFFLDSLTVTGSEAHAAAAHAGIPAIRRTLFLDHDPSPTAVRSQVRRAAELSLDGAPVVVIGHPSPAVVEILRQELPRLEAAGVGVYPLGEVVARSRAADPGGPPPGR
ncbi:MAG: divergent polysaccharide deacetylase family protein [Nannocystaceae bacterium]